MIRLFVGADGTNSDLESQAVLEYTVRKYASEPVEITWMQQAAKGPWSGWDAGSGRTPFTHFRWGIPAACGFEGRAVYCDSDFIFRADIAELWQQPMAPGVVLLLKRTDGKLKTCSMLIDCAAARGHIPTLDELRTMTNPNDRMLVYFREHRELLQPYAGNWNCIDGESYESLDDPRIKAIHYSRIETQPQLPHALKRLKAEGRSHWYTGEVRRHANEQLIALFDAELAAAVEAGYTVDTYRVVPFEGAQRRNFQYSHHAGTKL
jgi:hypothetical protein